MLLPRLIVVTGFVLLGAAPVVVEAATVGVYQRPAACPHGGGWGCVPVIDGVEFRAGAGETNDVELVVEDAGVLVRDRGAPLTAAAGCESVGPHEARCPRLRPEVIVLLGDNDDAFLAPSALPVQVDGEVGDDLVTGAGLLTGGAGEDRLVTAGAARGFLIGGEGDDVLVGGPIDDSLRGGSGRDRLVGGAGDDHLAPDPVARLDEGAGVVAADVVDGGDGRDTLSYVGATSGVTVDLLDPAPDGAGGDRVAGVEDLHGSEHDDVLRGDDQGNRIFGHDGDDVLAGNAGDDELLGASGTDRLSGGRGADRLDHLGFQMTRGERLSCGPGVDLVVHPQRGRVGADCERATFRDESTVTPHPIRLTRRSAEFRFECRPARSRCRLTLALARDGERRVFARRTFTRTAGTSILRLAIRRAAVRPRPGLRLRVRVDRVPYRISLGR